MVLTLGGVVVGQLEAQPVGPIRHLRTTAIGHVPGDGIGAVGLGGGTGPAVQMRTVRCHPLSEILVLHYSPSSDGLDKRAVGRFRPNHVEVTGIKLEVSSGRTGGKVYV